MKLQTYYQRYLKTFYGITGPFDEYKQQVVSRVTMQLYPLIFLGVGLITVITFIFAQRFPETSAWLAPLVIFIYCFSIQQALYRALKKAKVNDFDPEELSQEQVSFVYRSPVKYTLIWASIMFIWLLFSQMMLDRVSLLTALTNPRIYLGLAIGSITFFSVLTMRSRAMLKKKEEEPHD